MKLIPLSMWAQRRYAEPPSSRTLRRWATNGTIQPRPRKEGRQYWVQPNATVLDVTDPNYLEDFAKARESSPQ